MIVYLTSHIGGSYKKNGLRVATQLSTVMHWRMAVISLLKIKRQLYSAQHT